jgi:signal transduction histidine kinase
MAIACLASTWYINRLQADMAKTVRHDAVRLETAEELQIRLRQLRVHSLMAAADPSAAWRRERVDKDREAVLAALADAQRDSAERDRELLDAIERGYHEYEGRLLLDASGATIPPSRELIAWADAHPVQGLLLPCRELAIRQRDRMAQNLERSEEQTRRAGVVLLGLGLVGALGGILIGYATARGLTQRAAQLSVRVQAVQSQLDQEVGALTVVGTNHDNLDEQLDSVIGRVKEVCNRLQEQERDLLRAEQLAAVGHLAAGVAHEVRNPLTGIKFLVEGALRASNPTPLANEDLQLIRHEIVRMERTVQGLLDFARTPTLDRRQHDLRNLLTEAAGVVRGRAEAKPVILKLSLPPDTLKVRVDHDQLLSLLTNLLFNAIDATPPGGEVNTRVELSSSGSFSVEITDTGPGIDPVILNRLFMPFATTKPTGTGLGLTIARRIAKDHAGSLTATNRPEGGACFTLTLPAEESHAKAVSCG